MLVLYGAEDAVSSLQNALSLALSSAIMLIQKTKGAVLR